MLIQSKVIVKPDPLLTLVYAAYDLLPESHGGEGADLLIGAAVAGDEEHGDAGKLALLQVGRHLSLAVHVQAVLGECLRKYRYHD